MRHEDGGERDRSQKKESSIPIACESTESVEGERIKRESGEFGERLPHKQIYVEVRRINVCGRCKPASAAAEVQSAEQVHGNGGAKNNCNTGQVVSSGCFKAQRVPDFGNVVEQRWVKDEQRFSVSVTEVRRPSRQQNAVADVFMKLHQPRDVGKRVVTGDQLTCKQRHADRERESHQTNQRQDGCNLLRIK